MTYVLYAPTSPTVVELGSLNNLASSFLNIPAASNVSMKGMRIHRIYRHRSAGDACEKIARNMYSAAFLLGEGRRRFYMQLGDMTIQYRVITLLSDLSTERPASEMKRDLLFCLKHANITTARQLL